MPEDLLFETGLDGTCNVPIANESDVGISFDEGDVMAALWRPSRVEVFNAANYTGLAKHLDPESWDAGLALLQTCGGGEFQEEGGCDCDAAVESGDSIISRLDLAIAAHTCGHVPFEEGENGGGGDRDEAILASYGMDLSKEEKGEVAKSAVMGDQGGDDVGHGRPINPLTGKIYTDPRVEYATPPWQVSKRWSPPRGDHSMRC